MTTLIGEQAALTRVCFDLQPAKEDLQTLGSMTERWLLYRRMVRARLRRTLADLLPRTAGALGEERYGQLFDSWLAIEHPKTRYIREIVPAFASFALSNWEQEEWISDLLRFESAHRVVGYLAVPFPDAEAFAFELTPLVNPTTRRLRLRHRVHEPNEITPDGYPPQNTQLCIFRRPSSDRVAVWSLTDRAMDWFDALVDGTGSTTERIQGVAHTRGETIDAAYVASLGTTLSDLIDNELILGSAPN